MMLLASVPLTFASNALIPRSLSLPPWCLYAKPICRVSFTCALSYSPNHNHNHVYSHPIPEFAESETHQFQTHLFLKLSQDADEFGDHLDEVVAVCAQVIRHMLQIFSEFLHKEYGGPGTLLVEPFTDMMVALNKKKLPGAALAARASLLWAQNYVDKDWDAWNSTLK
ncbi:hypothetical protein Fmac_005571 [Flemingia macrophylla]|uniref:Uncharacterized protein n=1 Tax=Flemingia macrophylla TaxID=520843 RepID=A0ABD1N865_9FABA